MNAKDLTHFIRSMAVLLISLFLIYIDCEFGWAQDSTTSKIQVEKLSGKKWVSTVQRNRAARSKKFVVKVWFDQQFLGDGEAYQRRAKEFANRLRTELRDQVVGALKSASDKSYNSASRELKALLKDRTIENVQRHWIINGFTCTTTLEGLKKLASVNGVKKIFVTNLPINSRKNVGGKLAPSPAGLSTNEFDPNKYKHPWYTRALMAEKTWKEFGVTGQGTLNVVHDFNFHFPPPLKASLSDSVGFNFISNSKALTQKPGSESNQDMHGTMCAAIICGVGTDDCEYEFGIAPQAKWAGVIAKGEIEASVEWAIENSADTYSMSFSQPGLGEYRSHWRKVLEHGSFCGVYFVSGAGNFAKSQSVPTQMRTPEDIPEAVFAAAGVHRDFSRTEFSSKGPVLWKTEHYQDGKIQKPEVCAFNHGIPKLMLDGTIRPIMLNGNSFAGPMFCGSIALMVSADPELLPWDLKEIITSTATDVGPEGVDFETGHGLINCYRAVKEVLRRKAIREGTDPAPFTGRTQGDSIDKARYQEILAPRKLMVGSVVPGSPAQKGGLAQGDLIITIDGQNMKSEPEIRGILKNAGNKPVDIVVSRKGQRKELKVSSGGKGLRVIFEHYRDPVFK